MTSTTGTDAHPEVAEISALAEGVLPPERSADVRGHLEGCALCSDVQASLNEIRGLLGTLPGPPRMPSDIVGRIDAALAAEALLDATAPDVPRETEAPARVPRETKDRPSGRAAAPTGPGHTRPRRSRRLTSILMAASAAAVLGLGGVLLHTFTTGADGDHVGSGATTNATASDTLRTRAHDLLAAAGTTPRNSVESHTQGTDQAPLRQTAGSVPPCVLAAIHRAETPLATHRELFQGTDSFLVVLPHAADPSRVDAYAVDASCTTAPGHVLQQGTYPR